MKINNGKGLSKFMQRQLNRSLNTADIATERLTTGKRVNNAKDDVGAFFMSSQIHAYEQSQRLRWVILTKDFRLSREPIKPLKRYTISSVECMNWLFKRAMTPLIKVTDRVYQQNLMA